MAGDISLVKRLVRLGYNINAVEKSGKTVLLDATRHFGQTWWWSNSDFQHRLRMLRTLCDEGADVNFTPEGAKEGTYILYDLITGSSGDYLDGAHIDALKTLLKYDASPSRALHAIGEAPAWVSSVEVLLDAGADIEELWDNMTPLTWAALHKNPTVVQALINAGANVNGVGESALFAAITPNFFTYSYAPTTVAVLTILCTAGADMKKLNGDNHSILSYALTMSCPTTTVPLSLFEMSDSVQAVLEVLCNAGADVNFHHHNVPFTVVETHDENGDTPLHIAINACVGTTAEGTNEVSSNVAAECAEILISYGAEVNIQNNIGSTPLHSAVCRSNLAVIQVLLKHGGRVDVQDVYGNTPLMLAQAMKKSTKIVALLEKMTNSKHIVTCHTSHAKS